MSDLNREPISKAAESAKSNSFVAERIAESLQSLTKTTLYDDIIIRELKSLSDDCHMMCERYEQLSKQINNAVDCFVEEESPQSAHD